MFETIKFYLVQNFRIFFEYFVYFDCKIYWTEWDVLTRNRLETKGITGQVLKSSSSEPKLKFLKIYRRFKLLKLHDFYPFVLSPI